MEKTVSQSEPDIRPNFPFAAVAGQSSFKLALLLAAINPLVGGVLISGPRGSAKSTLAKGLADILPLQGDQPHPFVTLPLGASEEMLIGTLNLQQVLDKQEVAFQPGLLAKADNGVLYVDEVNLLPDNLVDQLLDVAASGLNTIERDGISHQHSAQFILLGTMNPDEGELRPQLTDRFGLSVNLSNQYSLDERIDIVKLREQFDKHEEDFLKLYASKQQSLTSSITTAKTLLSVVECSDNLRRLIAERCYEANVDGLRADIVWTQAALAHAALNGRDQVSEKDILAVEELVLNHRRNNNGDQNSSRQDNSEKPFSRPDQNHTSSQDRTQNDGDWGAMEPENQTTQRIAETPISHTADKTLVGQQKMTADVATNKQRGNAKGFRRSSEESRKVNWFSSFVASMSSGADACLRSTSGIWPLTTLRYYPRKAGIPVIHLVLLDTSGSVLANQAFAKAKGLILQIADNAYLQREQFALLGFGNQKIDTLVSLRRAPKAIIKQLDTITASGGTPFSMALNEAAKIQQQQRRKNAAVTFKNYIVTDGRVSQLDFGLEGKLAGDVVVIDIEQSQVKRGRAKDIASTLDAHYIPLTV